MKPTDFSTRWVSFFYGTWGSLGLIAVLLLIHLLTLPWSAVPEEMVGHYRSLGVSLSALKEGKVWVLLSYGFFHAGWMHLLVNLFGIIALGPKIERVVGARQMLKIFALGVFFGGIGQGLISLIETQEILLIGSSGGVVALLLWLTTVAGESPLRRLPLQARMLGWLVLLYEGMMLLLSFRSEYSVTSSQHISHACHLGGGLIGWWLAHRQFRLPPDLAWLKREREKHEKNRSFP